jgi:branched-chain amino acid:cation transporter, LIVCS family
MSYRRIVLTAGFAIFSMFFGSGNLVFPLMIGKETLAESTFGAFGLIITAVVVPFLGLIGMVLYQGSYQEYFAKLGKVPTFLLTGMMLSLMGPFGVVPRCITVAYGGVSLMLPSLPFWLFSLCFCFLITLLIWRPNKIVDVIGLLLTPFKLGGLILLMLAGLWYSSSADPSPLSSFQAFGTGLTFGYQTMDLMAAFFFSSTIVVYVRQFIHKPEDQNILVRLCVYASLIGASLLTLAYIGFVALGSRYAPLLAEIKPEEMLAKISFFALGEAALPVVSITLAVACLATAVILSSLFVQFIRQDVMQQKVTTPQAILLTVSMSYAISLLGFSKICEWLNGILEIAYPALIALAVMNIIHKVYPTKQGKMPFWLTLIASTLLKIYRLAI